MYVAPDLRFETVIDVWEEGAAGFKDTTDGQESSQTTLYVVSDLAPSSSGGFHKIWIVVASTNRYVTFLGADGGRVHAEVRGSDGAR